MPALLLVLLLALALEPSAGVYHPPNRPPPRVAQELKFVISSVHDLMFCRDCDDPVEQGAIVIPERFHAASERYFVSSVLVFAIPNDGSYALYNTHELAGKIAVFTRGRVSVAHKAQIAQSAGAVAALIMDSSECDPETMHCHRTVSVSPLLHARTDSDSHSDRRRRHGRGWRRFDTDAASAWLNVQIPVAMVSADDAARIRSSMDLVTVDVNGELNYLVGV